MAFCRSLALTRFLNISISSSRLKSPIPPRRSTSAAADSTCLLPKIPFPNHWPTPCVGSERLPFRAGRYMVDPRPFEKLLPPPGEAVIATQARNVMGSARGHLRDCGWICISYEDFAGICGEVPGADRTAAIERALNESGAVIFFGDVVLLRPELVARAIESLISQGHSQELKEMEEKKESIDTTAEASVRREMRCGLGLLALQTGGFMRLTFWDLSWDVMEPICFYVTSAYFMAGYAFFLRTSRDPSFEGFFHARFVAKQRRLMSTHGFDVERFNKLRKGHAVVTSKLLLLFNVSRMHLTRGCIVTNTNHTKISQTGMIHQPAITNGNQSSVKRQKGGAS